MLTRCRHNDYSSSGRVFPLHKNTISHAFPVGGEKFFHRQFHRSTEALRCCWIWTRPEFAGPNFVEQSWAFLFDQTHCISEGTDNVCTRVHYDWGSIGNYAPNYIIKTNGTNNFKTHHTFPSPLVEQTVCSPVLIDNFMKERIRFGRANGFSGWFSGGNNTIITHTKDTYTHANLLSWPAQGNGEGGYRFSGSTIKWPHRSSHHLSCAGGKAYDSCCTMRSLVFCFLTPNARELPEKLNRLEPHATGIIFMIIY